MRWSADGRALVLVPLDGLTACHHRPSGTTHLLCSPAPEILEALADAALTVPELLAALAERFDVPDPRGLAARVEELAAAGLVRAA